MRYAFFVAKRAGIFLVLWLVLTGADAGALWTGIPAAAAATLVSLRLLPPGDRSTSFVALVTLLPGFLMRSLLGGVDVARRVFHPDLPVKPGWITYATGLRDGTGRMALSSETSLLPGTLAAGYGPDGLYVHCLDTDGDAFDELRRGERRILRAMPSLDGGQDHG